MPALPIREIIEDNYPNTTPKEYSNIVHSYSATTGSRIIEKCFPNNTNKIQSRLEVNTNLFNTRTNFKFNLIG